MKVYIGTKIIKAEPMDMATFSNTVRTIGSLVEIDAEGKGKPGYKVVYADGYVSWSPKAVFEQAYREVSPEESKMLICH